MARKPKQKTLKKKCDILWSKIIRRHGVCEKCGSPRNLQAHHLISKSAVFYRHIIENGICLCPACHMFSNKFSAHGSPWQFELWLKEKKSWQYHWWEANRWKIVEGQKIDYAEVLERLEATAKDYGM